MTGRTKKYDKQDQQGQVAFNERNPHTISNNRLWQRVQGNPKQKQDRAQGRAWAGQSLKSHIKEIISN
jgi:hypothetical protein